MKKKLLIIALLLIVSITISGCSTKLIAKKVDTKVVCNLKQEQEHITINQEVTMEIKESEFKKATLDMNIIYDDLIAKNVSMDAVAEQMKKQLSSQYKDIKVEPTEKGAKVLINLDIDEMSTLSNISKDNLSNIKENADEEIKKAFINAGYTCK